MSREMLMKRFAIVLILTLFLVLPAWSQDTPKVDIFTDYALEGFDTGFGRKPMHGVGIGVHVPLNDALGIAVDASSTWGDAFGIDFNTQTFLGGIRITNRGDSAESFFHFMGGMATIKALGGSTTEPAFGTGGGIDVSLTDHIYYRIIQFDYVGIFAAGRTMNNVKVQTGFQFRF